MHPTAAALAGPPAVSKPRPSTGTRVLRSSGAQGLVLLGLYRRGLRERGARAGTLFAKNLERTCRVTVGAVQRTVKLQVSSPGTEVWTQIVSLTVFKLRRRARVRAQEKRTEVQQE